MSTKSAIPAETKMLLLAPLATTLVLGGMFFIVKSSLPSGLNEDVLVFCAAMLLIPAATYFYGRSLLIHLLGSGVDRTAYFAQSVAAGTHETSKMLQPHDKESIVSAVERLAAQAQVISAGITANVEKINSEVEQLAAGANEIMFTSQMQTAAINDTKQVMHDMSQRIQLVSELTRDTETISNKATSLDRKSVV